MRKRWRRVEAWFAAHLRERNPRAALIAIALFCLAGVFFLTGLKAAQDVFIDAAEAYAWGQTFLGGYGRHPPMTGWIAGVWYGVFPAADWSSYALSRVMTFVTLAALYFIACRVAGPRRALFVVLVMMLYPLFHTKGERFNNYQVLLALLPLLVLAFLHAYEKRNVLWGALLGLAAAACTLTIYSGLIGIAAIGLAALLHPDRMRFLRSPAPWIAALVYCVALTPHVLWLIKWNYPTLQWASSLAEQPGSVRHTLGYLGHHFVLVGIPIVVGAALAMASGAGRIGGSPARCLSRAGHQHRAGVPRTRGRARDGQLPAARLGQSALLSRAAHVAGAGAAARHAPRGRARRHRRHRVHADPADCGADLSVGQLSHAPGRWLTCAVSRDCRGTHQTLAHALQFAAAD